MALIKTIDEVRKYVPGVTTAFTDIDQLIGCIEPYEDYLIRPMLGSTILAGLQVAYEAETLSVAQTELLKAVQHVTCNVGVSEYMLIGRLQIQEQGITQAKDSAHGIAVENAAERLADRGYNGLERVLEVLERNAVALSYTEDWKHLINSATEFSKYYNINGSRRLFMAMLPILQKVEDMVISQSIGQEYFNELLEEQSGPTIPANILIQAWLKSAVAHLVVAQAVEELPVELRGDSVVLIERVGEGRSARAADLRP